MTPHYRTSAVFALLALCLIVVPVSATVVTVYSVGKEDGILHYAGSGAAYGTYRNHAGNYVNTGLTFSTVELDADTVSNKFVELDRTYYEFNMSNASPAIPSNSIIDSITVSIPGTDRGTNQQGLGVQTFVLTRFRPATNGTAVSSDFNKFDDDKLSDNTYTSSTVHIDSYNNFTLNAAGLANFSTSGYNNYMLRNEWDRTNTSPTWSSGAITQQDFDMWEHGDYLAFIKVTYHASATIPTANFTCSPLIGEPPLYVTCTDSSTNTPTGWNWSYKNSTVDWTIFNTTQNPIISLPTGTYSINLTAANAAGLDTKTRTSYIQVNGTIKTYPVTQINSTRILPFNSSYFTFTPTFYSPQTTWNTSMLPPQGLNVSINITPGDYEQASFVIQPSSAISGITLTNSTLSDGNGHTLGGNALDIRLVKVWFQGAASDVANFGGLHYTVLAPELLLKNDSIVRVNYTAQYNEVWIKNNTFEGYAREDNTTSGTTEEYGVNVFDNATSLGYPQPLTLAANENKQVWLTVKAPAGAVAGNYTGTITISSPTTTDLVLNLSVRVLPFTLVNATKDFGMTYAGHMSPSDYLGGTLGYPSSNWKTASQIQPELQDMYNHGIRYPTFGNDNNSRVDDMFNMRATVGFPKDRIYLFPGGGWETSWSDYLGEPQSVPDLLAANNTIKMWLNRTNTYGYTNTYFYAINENDCPDCLNERPVIAEVHANGAKEMGSAYVAESIYYNNMGDVIDAINRGIYLGFNNTEAGLWHSRNAKVLLYNMPQMGVENPEIYRNHYGLALWNSSYDGTLMVSYEQCNLDCWNDFDDPVLRDENVVYPVTNSIVPTIQWEGIREGIDDTRYADTLTSITGNKTEANNVFYTGNSAGQDMSQVRNTLIAHILVGEGMAPVASFTSNTTSGVTPLSVQFTDTSIYLPTGWNWSWGDTTWTNGTTRNATHIYGTGGTYPVFLIASNAHGSNQSASQSISVYNQTSAQFFQSDSYIVVPPSKTVTFNATTANATMWNWSFHDGTWFNTTNPALANVTKTYYTGGHYTVNLTTSDNGWGASTASGYVDAFNQTTSGFTGTPTSGFASLPVTFNVTNHNDNATMWNWSFGDGQWQNGTQQNATHTYNSGGVFTVIEIASNPYATNTTTRTDYIEVWNHTTNDFSANQTIGYIPMAVQFTDTSYNATDYYWEFGDGATSIDQNPVHSYTVPGIYSVNHESTNAHDFFWTNKSNYINVLSNPVHADFYADTTSGNAPITVHFTDTSTNATTWSWDFGDSNSSSSRNPTHIYSFAGTFTVSLTASNTYSTDTMTKVDYIVVSSPLPPAPVANFTATPLSGYTPLLVSFTDESTGIIDTWLWNFGDGNTSGSSSPSHTYAFAGTFDVSLQVSNTGGSDTMTKLGYITVTTDTTPPASITNLTGTPTSSCDGIIWKWIDPTDADFSYILAWLNGVAVGNVPKGVQQITLSGLAANTTYTVSSKTVDTHGNINATFVNASATTNSMNCTAPATGSKIILVQGDSEVPLPTYLTPVALCIAMGIIIMHKRQRKA